MDLLKGIVVTSKKDGTLVINGVGKYAETQRGVLIKQADIALFNLQEGDDVIYYGRPYETVHVHSKTNY